MTQLSLSLFFRSFVRSFRKKRGNEEKRVEGCFLFGYDQTSSRRFFFLFFFLFFRQNVASLLLCSAVLYILTRLSSSVSLSLISLLLSLWASFLLYSWSYTLRLCTYVGMGGWMDGWMDVRRGVHTVCWCLRYSSVAAVIAAAAKSLADCR